MFCVYWHFAAAKLACKYHPKTAINSQKERTKSDYCIALSSPFGQQSTACHLLEYFRVQIDFSRTICFGIQPRMGNAFCPSN
jgi:hypothetical protein